ncbi:MAG: DUF2892 domain-containing protein [Planctomycetota bacterium]|nr:DUF2892 domain-containing protein [Planctomycetota bacterium]
MYQNDRTIGCARAKIVGLFDRIARGKLGLLAMIQAFTVHDMGSDAVAGVAGAMFGVVASVTAAAVICPLSLPFKVKTCNV